MNQTKEGWEEEKQEIEELFDRGIEYHDIDSIKSAIHKLTILLESAREKGKTEANQESYRLRLMNTDIQEAEQRVAKQIQEAIWNKGKMEIKESGDTWTISKKDLNEIIARY